LPTLSSGPRPRSEKGGCPIRWPSAWLSACSCTLLLAACGGSEATPEPAPKLPPAVAERLATEADAVAARLEAGDPCGAAAQAAALQQRVIEAQNRPSEVPDALREDLGLAVAELVDRTQGECAAAQPPPSPATTAEDDEGDEGRGRGKGKGRGKGRGKGDDD
jgi:hypothetical protein